MGIIENNDTNENISTNTNINDSSSLTATSTNTSANNTATNSTANVTSASHSKTTTATTTTTAIPATSTQPAHHSNNNSVSDQCDMTSLEILNKCHLDLFPKKPTVCDDDKCMAVLEQIPILNGEYIQFIGKLIPKAQKLIPNLPLT
jgi:hypothetical protein